MNLIRLFIIIGLAGSLIGCSEKQTAESHITNAQNYISENKLSESVIELKNAIRLSPKNGQIRFLLGNVYLQQGSGIDAVKELEKAQEFGYLPNKVIPALSRGYMLLESDDDILALAPQAENLAEEAKMQYLAYKTLAALRTNDLALATEAEQQANGASYISAYASLSSAYLALANNKLDDAQLFLNKVFEISPQLPDAIILQAKLHTANQEHENATKKYLEYANLQPKSTVVILFIAESLLKEKKFDQAQQYADRILASLPNQPFAQYVKAIALFENKDYVNAQLFAEKALSSKFQFAQLKLVAGASAYFQNNFEQSHYHLKAIIKVLPLEHPARKMFAISQLQLGLVNEIGDTLANFDSSGAEDDKFLSSLSYQLAEMGAIEDAKKLADKTTQSSNADAQSKVRAGILKLMLNDPSGISNLKDAIAIEPNLVGAEIALAYAAIQNNDFEQALSIADKWADKYPDKPGSYNVKAAVLLKQGKVKEAQDILEQSLTKQADNLYALTELTNIAIKNNDLAQASELNKKARDSYPNNVRLLKQYYTISKSDQALAEIKAFYQKNQDNEAAVVLYLEVLLNNKNVEEAEEIANKQLVSIKTGKRFWQLHTIIYRQLNDMSNYERVLQSWTDNNPYHVEPVLLLVDMYANNRDTKTALKVVERALSENHQENMMLKMAKIQLLLDSQMLEPAKTFYHDEIVKIDIKNNIKQGLLGRIFLLERDYVKAVPLLEKFYQSYPSSQNISLLVATYQGMGQTDKSIEMIETYLDKNPEDNRVRNQLASLYLLSDESKAISSYEKILETQKNNVVVLNNLAWLSMEKGELAKAAKYAEKAYSLAPQVPNVVDTYAQVLMRKGEKRQALIKEKEAFELSKGKDVDIALNYAEVLQINSRRNEAFKLLAKILPQNDVQSEKKQKLLSNK